MQKFRVSLRTAVGNKMIPTGGLVLLALLTPNSRPAWSVGTSELNAAGSYAQTTARGPVLGKGIERLGTFQIEKVSVRQQSRTMFRPREINHGDICKKDPFELAEADRLKAESACGTRVWAYRADGQIFFFEANWDEVIFRNRLQSFPFTSTTWASVISLDHARKKILTSKVMRGFSIPVNEISDRPELEKASEASDLYAFCGSSDPGEVVSTEARAILWNAKLLLFGVTLNPLYVIEVPKNENIPNTIKITEQESLSLLLMSRSTFYTEYHLKRISD